MQLSLARRRRGYLPLHGFFEGLPGRREASLCQDGWSLGVLDWHQREKLEEEVWEEKEDGAEGRGHTSSPSCEVAGELEELPITGSLSENTPGRNRSSVWLAAGERDSNERPPLQNASPAVCLAIFLLVPPPLPYLIPPTATVHQKGGVP